MKYIQKTALLELNQKNQLGNAILAIAKTLQNMIGAPTEGIRSNQSLVVFAQNDDNIKLLRNLFYSITQCREVLEKEPVQKHLSPDVVVRVAKELSKIGSFLMFVHDLSRNKDDPDVANIRDKLLRTASNSAQSLSDWVISDHEHINKINLDGTIVVNTTNFTRVLNHWLIVENDDGSFSVRVKTPQGKNAELKGLVSLNFQTRKLVTKNGTEFTLGTMG